MTRFLLGLVVIVALAAPASAQIPVPPPLLEAKTAFLVNNGMELRFLERLAQELTRHKLFTLVGTAQEADIVITIGSEATGMQAGAVAGVMVAETTKRLLFTVNQRAGGAELWSDTERLGGTTGGVANIVGRLNENITAAKTRALKP